jgi:hypothetical protein
MRRLFFILAATYFVAGGQSDSIDEELDNIDKNVDMSLSSLDNIKAEAKNLQKVFNRPAAHSQNGKGSIDSRLTAGIACDNKQESLIDKISDSRLTAGIACNNNEGSLKNKMKEGKQGKSTTSRYDDDDAKMNIEIDSGFKDIDMAIQAERDPTKTFDRHAGNGQSGHDCEPSPHSQNDKGSTSRLTAGSACYNKKDDKMKGSEGGNSTTFPFDKTRPDLSRNQSRELNPNSGGFNNMAVPFSPSLLPAFLGGVALYFVSK